MPSLGDTLQLWRITPSKPRGVQAQMQYSVLSEEVWTNRHPSQIAKKKVA